MMSYLAAPCTAMNSKYSTWLRLCSALAWDLAAALVATAPTMFAMSYAPGSVANCVAVGNFANDHGEVAIFSALGE
jgi:hypothetical protein